MPAIMAKRKEFEPRDLAFLALQDDRAPHDFLNPAGTAEKQGQGGSSRDPQLGFSAGTNKYTHFKELTPLLRSQAPGQAAPA